MIAFIYARKSTEQNSADAEARSVARQVEGARAFATTRGWTAPAEFAFADDAVSGADVRRSVKCQPRRASLLGMTRGLCPQCSTGLAPLGATSSRALPNRYKTMKSLSISGKPSKKRNCAS